MKFINLTSTAIYLGTSTGQLEGYIPGTLQFATERQIEGASWMDVEEVLGSLATLERDGYTNQGGHLFRVTDDQISAITSRGAAKLAAEEARHAKAYGLVTYEDINDMLRSNGNAAAAE